MGRNLSAGILFASVLAVSGITFAGNVHFVGSPTCVQSGGQLCCSGKLAGLGTAPTKVRIDAAFSCTNRGEHQPGGLASGESGPITPRGGQITFTNVCTTEGSCPDQMTPTFGPTATINVFQNGNLVFSATIPVS
jgi:hypothetical protein